MGDSWFSKDKFKHFGASYAWAVVHPMAAVGAGVTKEYCDSKDKGNHWCWKDIVWNILGTVLGTLTHYLIFKSWLGY